MTTVNNNKYDCLIVEDDRLATIMLETMLYKLDITTISAETGEIALEMMKEKQVNVMLLDISLGAGISGVTLMREFRKDSRFNTIPIIAVTAHTFRELEEYMVKDGFSDYLAKPYEIFQLKELIERHGSLNNNGSSPQT